MIVKIESVRRAALQLLVVAAGAFATYRFGMYVPFSAHLLALLWALLLAAVIVFPRRGLSVENRFISSGLGNNLPSSLERYRKTLEFDVSVIDYVAYASPRAAAELLDLNKSLRNALVLTDHTKRGRVGFKKRFSEYNTRLRMTLGYDEWLDFSKRRANNQYLIRGLYEGFYQKSSVELEAAYYS
jgi:hypothetical protein